jgi:hypothetical protein
LIAASNNSELGRGSGFGGSVVGTTLDTDEVDVVSTGTAVVETPIEETTVTSVDNGLEPSSAGSTA